MKRVVTSLLTLAAVVYACSASATTFWVIAKIEKTLVDSEQYAGCMLRLDKAIGNGCNGNWVSLDCAGRFYTTLSGEQKFAAALMAQAADKQVRVLVDPTKTVNGNYCIARRIDVDN